MEIAALSLLIFFSLLGFAAIFFTTFGTLLILIGSILYAFMTGFEVINFQALIVLCVLYLCGEALEYVFIIAGAKKLGASNWAVAGALIGGILGATIGTLFFGVGIILGTFLGIFLGAFLVEMIVHKDMVKSLKAATGGVLGRVFSIGAKIVIAVLMFAVIIYNFMQTSGPIITHTAIT
ncbi:MAG: DUF456 domain-containing protein [Candidatus Omnitrophota bacterium]